MSRLALVLLALAAACDAAAPSGAPADDRAGRLLGVGPALTHPTYYIAADGDDESDGLSPATPWRTFKNVFARRASFQPGDRILLHAGDEFAGPLSVASSGLTFSSYGPGADPIIRGDHGDVTWSEVAGHPGLYSTTLFAGNINSVYGGADKYAKVARGSATLDSWLATFAPGSWGYDPTSSGSGTIYLLPVEGEAPGAVHFFEAAVRVFRDVNDVTFTHLDVRDAEFGFFIAGSDGTIVEDCHVHDVLVHGINLTGATGAELARNTITRSGETSIYSREGGGHWIHDNDLSHTLDTILGAPIVPGIPPERCGVGLQQGLNNLVERNHLSYLEGSFIDFWLETGSTVRHNFGFHAGGAAFPQGTGLAVHGNIFDVDGGSGIGGAHAYDASDSPGPDAGPVLVYNNVIRNFSNYCLWSMNGANLRFRNNLCTTSHDASAVLFSPGTDSDYNAFDFQSGVNKGWKWGPQTGTTSSDNLADFVSLSGQEAHSISAPARLVATSPAGPDDYRLADGSACIDHGQDLLAAGWVTAAYTDFDGVAVPQGGGADIGAFER